MTGRFASGGFRGGTDQEKEGRGDPGDVGGHVSHLG